MSRRNSRNHKQRGLENSNADTSSMTSIKWTCRMETTPVGLLLYQNFDYSTFPQLVKTIYKHLKLITSFHPNHPNAGILPPYCVFLHVCTGILNAAILKQCHLQNPDLLRCSIIDNKYFKIWLPTPIIEYIHCIVNTKTVLGHLVQVHMPEVAVPRAYLPSAPEIPGGSFGPADEYSHNVYECYVSPYVTRRLVEATRDGEEHWEPLPEHLKPAGGIPNQNLLGYDKLEELDSYQRDFLKDKKFQDDLTGVDARLHWSDDLAYAVSQAMREFFEFYYEMKTVENNGWYPRATIGMVGFVEIRHRQYDNDTYLAPINCGILSWQKFMGWFGNIQLCLGMKRKRNTLAPGLCYTLENKEAPNGWMEHINDNFEMKGIFERKYQEGSSQLQCANFMCFDTRRTDALHNFIKHYIKDRPFSDDSD